uniref:glycosyltransferase n=1 Tax=Aliarcobacter butzleri TaxID=28197 RepID=UPI001D035CCF
KEDLNKLSVWWLKNQDTLPYLKEETRQYFFEYHCLTKKEITPLMKLIWETRLDLQSVYPNIDSNNFNDYWEWWISNGHKEYNVPVISIKNKEELEIFFIEIIWDIRKDLKDVYSKENNKDIKDFLKWVYDVGLKEYKILENYKLKEDLNKLSVWWLKNQDTLPYLKEETRQYFFEYHCLTKKEITPLMKLIWETRLDLQSVYPNIDSNNFNDYWEWWISNGHKEYNVPVISIKNKEELEIFFIEIIWDIRKDLKDVYSKENNKDIKDFLKWVYEFGIKEYRILEKYINKLDKDKNLLKNKIAIIGHPTGTFGLGEDARLIKESLVLGNFEVDSYIANKNILATKDNQITAYNLDNYTSEYVVNIFCLPAFDMIGIALDYDLNIFCSTINIAIWQWELPNFPREADFSFKLVHEICSISQFSAKSIQKNTSKEVKIIPLPVKQYTFDSRNREYFGLPENTYIYFFAFDRNSFIERKNPLAIIESFQRAFISEDVSLVIKAMGNLDSQIWKECYRRAKTDRRIFIIDKTLNKNDFLALMNTSNAVISLHRSEGFGRILAESFLMSKPLIISNYSGNLDFTNRENSYLVSGNIIETFEDDYLFSKNNFWFEVDINDASKNMYDVFVNREIAIRKANLGKSYIENNYSLANTLKFLNNLLKRYIDERTN